MNLSPASTALFVKNIELSKAFYSEVLGLVVDMDFGKNVIFKGGLAIWEVQPGHIIPTSLGLSKIENSAVNRFELYFETEDLQEVCSTLTVKGTKFLHEIHEEPWGQRTIRFFDPDNHLIEVGETMKQFVSRFYKQGMTVEEVSKRTSVPVYEVKRIISK
jgi:catechol 2,3-dioxygenase-like lactoylglutathione lyase family enzyme